MSLKDILGGNFNAEEAATAELEYTTLPDDNYPVVVEEAEITPTKDGEGTQLRVRLTVTAGQYKGERVFDNMVLAHPRAGRQFYGRKRLGQLCLAGGIKEFGEIGELLGIAATAYIVQNGSYNNVEEYKPLVQQAKTGRQAPKSAQRATASTTVDFDDDISF